MTESKDGGSVFPFSDWKAPDGSEASPTHLGLTKREYFAAAALMGLAVNQEMLLANKDLIERFGTNGIDGLQANKAFRLADAMLVEGDKPK